MEKVYKVYFISMQGIKSIVSCIKSSHVCLESTLPPNMLIFINVHIINARRQCVGQGYFWDVYDLLKCFAYS